MKSQILFYARKDPYYEFSNFSPHGFEDRGLYWPTVEHYFQAQKFPEQPAYQEAIRKAEGPAKAKKLGQTRNFPIRSDWEESKDEVMAYALRKKFADPKLRDLLIGTGKKTLVENSPTDRYWGIGSNGRGKNQLGVLLMRLREELKNER